MPLPAQLLPAANPFVASLAIPYKPSRWLLVFIVLSHCAALISISFLSIAWLYKLLVVIGILGSALQALAIHSGLWRRYRFSYVIWGEFGEWEVWLNSQQRLAARLLEPVFTSTYLTILRLETSDKRRFVLILTADNLSADQRQHLQRRLKWRKP